MGVASSLFRFCASAASLMSDSFDSKEAVLKEDLLACPNTELPVCAGVLAQDGNEDPVPEPTVTVEPKLGSVFKPPRPDFCWPCPSDPKPDWAPLLLPKLEKPDPPPVCPNLANPEAPPADAKGLALGSAAGVGAPQGDDLLPIPPVAPNPEPAPTAEAAPKAG